MNELALGMIQYIEDPVLFVKNVLRAEPDAWQAETLQALADGPRVAVRSGHGVGKTALESWVLLWFLFTRPYPKVPCTAPTEAQLHDLLWAEASKWLGKAPALKPYFEWQKTKIVQKQYPERWFATARTSNKPENIAGFHEEHLLFIIDEASGVPDDIFETIEGSLTTPDAKLLMCGNPTKNSGVFHDAFFRDRSLYWVRKVSCLDSPRVTEEYAERLKKKYHEDSDVYRVRVLGEFPKGEPDTFIPLDIVEAAIMREIGTEGELEIGADIARFGNDETVLAARVGLMMVYLKAYSKQDTMTTTGLIITLAKDLMKKYRKPRCTVKVDDDGVGGGVTDRLREVIREQHLYITVVPCHNGGISDDREHYENWGTESWAHVRDLLQEGGIELMNDEDLIGQLTTRKYKITSKGKIVLETKEEMKKRGLNSPDRADAVVLAFAEASGKADPAAASLLNGVRIYGMA